jgi:uncharacterized membrane protein HdeD (DUF308 family)
MPKLARLTYWVLGALFVVAGVMTVAFGEPGDQHHNLLHLTTGLVAVIAGTSRDSFTARIFCIVFGAGYLASLGYILGDPQYDRLWQVGVLHLAKAEHLFHIVLGCVVLAAGLLTVAAASRTTPPTAWSGATQGVVVGSLTVAAPPRPAHGERRRPR